MKYIRKIPERPQFYAAYGSFMHRLIEEYYTQNRTKEEQKIRFCLDFSKEVFGERPSASVVDKYIKAGVKYWEDFEPLPFDPIAIEKRVEYEISGIPFVGVIDYIGNLGDDYIIVDNKSRDLKPRSKRKNPTNSDRELDEMLIQLYLYSEAVRQEYGKFPKELCFNCFKTGALIREPFREEAYEAAVQWACSSVAEIMNADDFHPYIEYFPCKYICGLNHECCYYEMR